MAGRIQNEDIKSLAELVAAGGAKAQLPNDDRLYVAAFSSGKTMQEVLQQRLLHGLPLWMHANTTPDAKLYIEANTATTLEGTALRTPPQGTTLPTVVASTIDFQLNTTSGATFSITFPATTVGLYRRMGITLLPSGVLSCLFSGAQALQVNLADPGTLFDTTTSGAVPLGYIDLESTNAAGKFKTIGSATNVIENAVSASPRIFMFGSGGSGGGGGGLTGTALLVVEDIVTGLTGTTVTFPNNVYSYGQLAVFYRNGVKMKLVTSFSVAGDASEYMEVNLSTNSNQILLHSNFPATTSSVFEFYFIKTINGVGLALKTTSSARCFSDNTSTMNCSVATLGSNKTQVTLTNAFTYTLAWGAGGPKGDMTVEVNGQEIERLITGVNDAVGNIVYEEVSGTVFNVFQIGAGGTFIAIPNSLPIMAYVDGVKGGTVGGGGSGASKIDPDQESKFIWYTRDDFSIDSNVYVSSLTGAQDQTSSTPAKVVFSAAGQIMVSKDLAGSGIRDEAFTVNQVQGRLWYNYLKTDPSPTIEFSRDGGASYVTGINKSRLGTDGDIVVADGIFSGESLYVGTGTNGAAVTGNKVAALYTPAFNQTITGFDTIISTSATSGTFFGALYSVTAGVPVTLLKQSNETLVAGQDLGASQLTKRFSFAPITLTAGTTYAFVVDGAALVGGTLSGVAVTGVGSASAGRATFNGGSWTGSAAFMSFDVYGSGCDLRIRVTASTPGASTWELYGFGLDYVLNGQFGSTGVALYEDRTITATEASTGLITLNNISYTMGQNQVRGNFGGHVLNTQNFTELSPSQLQFASGFFSAGDVVRFEVAYGLVDGTSKALNILAANHLGSTTASLDQSVAGRGIILKRPDGTLRELIIDNLDNIQVLSVP